MKLLKEHNKEIKLQNKIASKRNNILLIMDKSINNLSAAVKTSTDSDNARHKEFIDTLEISCIRKICYVKAADLITEEIKDADEEFEK